MKHPWCQSKVVTGRTGRGPGRGRAIPEPGHPLPLQVLWRACLTPPRPHSPRRPPPRTPPASPTPPSPWSTELLLLPPRRPPVSPSQSSSLTTSSSPTVSRASSATTGESGGCANSAETLLSSCGKCQFLNLLLYLFIYSFIYRFYIKTIDF